MPPVESVHDPEDWIPEGVCAQGVLPRMSYVAPGSERSTWRATHELEFAESPAT